MRYVAVTLIEESEELRERYLGKLIMKKEGVGRRGDGVVDGWMDGSGVG